ncbi:SPARC-like protein 1 [Rhinoderma darwinii]|uniref:SPARC-like protein 1 n=1 Tax=Rhinoderma darwinii TaxID=43563 RepID=UPI003F665F6B
MQNIRSILNESLKEQKHKEKDVIDQYAITDIEPNTESIIQSKHKIHSGDMQTEETNIKPGTFSMEYLMNLINGDIDNNEPSPVELKDNHDSENEKKIEEYEDSVIDEVESSRETQKERKPESQESESKDQQNQGLSSDPILKQYEIYPIKLNTANVKPVEEGNKGYANILEEILDDEDLQYVLNVTPNLDTVRQRINNETYDEIYVEEPSHEDVIDFIDLETETNIKEEHLDHAETSRDGRKIKKENLVKEENGAKTRNIFGDLIIKQNESAMEEQQSQQTHITVNNNNKLRGDVPDVDYSSEITTIDHNDRNAEKVTTAFPRYLESSSERNVSLHDHDVDAAVQKEEGSLEINNMNPSADLCINFHCKRGKTCKTDGLGNPFCACQDPDYCLPGNRNDLVCGTDNKTYTSACHLFGTKCHLEGTKEGGHLHLDYQGPCKDIPLCTEYELTQFPFRMRDWLKNVLIQLYERDQENIGLLSEKQKSKVKKIFENEKRLQEGDHNIELLVKDFKKNYHMYVYPVHWQFYQLDQHSMDRLLTHSELAALRAPLIPIEHCVNTFLQECNTNNDKHISLWEWCRCFGIKEDDIDEDLLF